MRRNRTFKRPILLWIQSFGDTFSALVMRTMHKIAVEHGYDLIVRDMGVGLNVERSLRMLNQWQVGGVIVLGGNSEGCRFVQDRRKPFVPIVTISGNYGPNIDHVGIDLRYGAREATQHLIAVGCKRIAFFGARAVTNEGYEHRQGYLDAMAQARMTPEFITPNSDGAFREMARLAVMDYVQRLGPPDGIFCSDDALASGAYRALHELAIHIPDDVALVGCNGLDETEYYETPVSTLVQPIYEMCMAAWEFIVWRSKDPMLSQQSILLRPKLAIRQSSMRAVSENP